MQPEQLFGIALGITLHWEVKEISFSPESKRLDISIDFQKGAQFPCPVCGKIVAGVRHDRERMAPSELLSI